MVDHFLSFTLAFLLISDISLIVGAASSELAEERAFWVSLDKTE